MFSKKGYNADAKLLISLGLRHYPSKFYKKNTAPLSPSNAVKPMFN